MSVESVKAYLGGFGYAERVREFEESCATVELAAQAIGVTPERIAKSITFRNAAGDGGILIVTAGDAKIDNAKFKAQFGMKATMLKPDEVIEYIGHAVGGVCPFAIKDGVQVCLDASLRRFETIFPACGSSNSMIELTADELVRLSGSDAWVDVCKNWE